VGSTTVFSRLDAELLDLRWTTRVRADIADQPMSTRIDTGSCSAGFLKTFTVRVAVCFYGPARASTHAAEDGEVPSEIWPTTRVARGNGGGEVAPASSNSCEATLLGSNSRGREVAEMVRSETSALSVRAQLPKPLSPVITPQERLRLCWRRSGFAILLRTAARVCGAGLPPR
jgi:hypothetical protein